MKHRHMASFQLCVWQVSIYCAQLSLIRTICKCFTWAFFFFFFSPLYSAVVLLACCLAPRLWWQLVWEQCGDLFRCVHSKYFFFSSFLFTTCFQVSLACSQAACCWRWKTYPNLKCERSLTWANLVDIVCKQVHRERIVQRKTWRAQKAPVLNVLSQVQIGINTFHDIPGFK